jgi:rubrerythrin
MSLRPDDLALPELAAIRVRRMTREAFLVRSTLAAAAVYGLGAVAPFVRGALAQEASGDLATLNFALTLEKLEARFYDDARGSVRLDGDARALTDELASEEAQHVTALTETIGELGGRPVPDPEVDFLNAFRSQRGFLRLAQIFEETGVASYNGAAPSVGSSEVLAALGSIVQVEGRHAALVRQMRGEKPAPKAFDDTLSEAQVRERIEPFLLT